MMWHSHRLCHLRIGSEISCDHVTTCVTSQSSGYSATVYMGGGAIWTGRSLSIPLWQLGHILFHALPLIKITRIPTKSRWSGDRNKSPPYSPLYTLSLSEKFSNNSISCFFYGKVIENQKPKVENWPGWPQGLQRSFSVKSDLFHDMHDWNWMSPTSLTTKRSTFLVDV